MVILWGWFVGGYFLVFIFTGHFGGHFLMLIFYDHSLVIIFCYTYFSGHLLVAIFCWLFCTGHFGGYLLMVIFSGHFMVINLIENVFIAVIFICLQADLVVEIYYYTKLWDTLQIKFLRVLTDENSSKLTDKLNCHQDSWWLFTSDTDGQFSTMKYEDV